MRNLKYIITAALAAVSTIHISSSPASAESYAPHTFKMGATAKYWDQMAACQSGTTVDKVNWRATGTLAGGLKIMSNGSAGDMDEGIWEYFGGEDFAPSPDKATKHEQIIVANRIAVLGWQPPQGKRIAPMGYKAWPCVKSNKIEPYWKSTYTVFLPTDESKYCPRFAKLFAKWGLPVKVFSYIAWRESRCNPGAVNAKWKDGKIVWTLNKNGTYDSGLLQINSSWSGTVKREMGLSYQDLSDPKLNTMFASWILHYTTSRLGNWSVRTY